MKLKVTIGILFLCLSAASLSAQQYFTRSGELSFYSSTPIEDIEAINKSVTAVFDSQTGALQISSTVSAFQFEKALMQEHFNENYMESEDFPKATFNGEITNISKVDFATNGVYPIAIEGELTMHGKTNRIVGDGKLVVENGKVHGSNEFKVKPEDYGIVIPSVVREKIAKEITIKSNMLFQKK